MYYLPVPFAPFCTFCFTVVSAGNDDQDACNQSPAREVTAITVGATYFFDERTDFSNYGPCVDIFSPGSNIMSAWHKSDDASLLQYGTSMAAPHVTGVAALYLSFNPEQTPAQVTRAILSGSTKRVIPNPGDGSPNRLLFSRFRIFPPPGQPGALYRYWGNGDHFYTTNWYELSEGYSGYTFESIQCYIHLNQQPGTIPLRRYWGHGDHFYTTNWNELGAGREGYIYEGIQGYVYPNRQPGTVPLYRYWGHGDHFYTTNWNELGDGNDDYTYEGIQCYVMTAP